MGFFVTLSSLLAFIAITTAASTLADGRTKYNFNSDWKILVGDSSGAEKSSFDDHAWKNVAVPHAWNEDDAFRFDIANLSTGIAWYRKHFSLPNSTIGNKIFFEFEGIRHAGEFYLNDKWIGRSENGVMGFGFDVSDIVLQGKDNVLAARIDNSWDYREKSTNSKYQWNDKNFYANYGGINKNVYLHVTNKLYQTLPLYSNLNTTGVYVYAQDINIAAKTAKVTAEAQVRNEYPASKTFTYRFVVQETDGKILSTVNGQSYTLSVNQTKVLSASAQVNGLNFWSWGYGYLYDVSTILEVDGQEIDRVKTRTGFRKTDFSKGMFKLNERTLHLKGYAQRTTNEWPALGCAVPAWLSDFSNRLVLDSHGSLVRWMHVTPWKQDVESLDRLGILQAMPAGDSEGDPKGRQWEQRLELMRDATIYHRNNPSIVFYEAGNHGISEDHMSQIKKIRDTYDPYGGRASGSREMLNSTVAEYGGEMLYINKGARIPFWQMEYSRDEGLRKYWDNYSPPYHRDGDGPPYKDEDASEYNRNQDSHAVENVNRWFDYYQQRPGTGTRVNAGGVNIVFSDSNTHHRGAENYRRSGEVDATRLPKDGWFAHQVMWNTWVDVEVPAVHIIGHWNYNTSTTKDVTVISSSDKVELLLNGKSLGQGVQSKRFLFTFNNVTFSPGELKAVGFDSKGNEVTSDTRQTAGEPAGIRLTSHTSPTGFQASGADIAMVDVEVIDAKGKRCPTALNLIKFTLSGEAEWRGGIAQGPSNYILSKQLPVENGINRVLLRSTAKAGLVTLLADAQGLASASMTLNAIPYNITNGLSRVLPGTDLPSVLVRGPTPSGESYKLNRQPIPITSATAGSDSSMAALTFDDNEYSQWTTTSGTDSSWIKYTLKSTAKVNQVVLKTVAFRTKQYAIRVSIDDTAVWTGKTELSLGYVTITFPATNGKTVTVASTSGNLGLIEVEMYAPV